MMKNYKPSPYIKDNNKLYEPYQGFIRGNLFENLYDPYKVNGPYEIKPMNEQAELLTYIDNNFYNCSNCIYLLFL